ncbi:restriction endonuclease subunit S [Longispora sp. K20-0274]|uniref:restriction endonuclease subunit S n=1 Tax=Longispora sp. K20-0274 TaxID=3088255 RepID=UPI003999A10A
MSYERSYSVDRWLGALPERFAVARLSHIARAWTSNVDKHSVEGETSVRLCNYTDVYKNAVITAELPFMAATATAEQIERFRLRRGDTVITKDSETADDIGIPAYVDYEADDLVCGYHLAIVRPDASRACPRYLYWVMGSTPVLRQWGVLAAGVTRVGIRSTDLTKVSIPLPSVNEQREIADFLDEQTSWIDTLIDKQTQLIAILRERASAQLSSHFGAADQLRVTSVRRVLRPLVRPALPGLGVITAYRDGAVTLRSARREGGYTFSESEAGYQEIRPGDLVFHALDGFAGACGVSDSHGMGSPVYHICEPVGDDDVEYLALLLRFLGTSGYLATQAPNVRQRSVDFRNWTTFAQVPLRIPSPAKQRSFVIYYKKQESQVRAVISKIERHIALAKERRAVLITAAVTGQIDVRTAGRTTPGVA